MDVELTLKNYRCFPDTVPARITVRNGICAFVGINNSGKSSLLKFFYEFRSLFQGATNPNAIIGALRGQGQALNLSGVYDPAEIFSNQNDRDLQIQLDLVGERGTPLRPVITVGRHTGYWVMEIYWGDRLLPTTERETVLDGTMLTVGGQSICDLAPLIYTLKQLGSSLYFAAFRNIINVGSNDNYYDIQTGQAFVRKWRSLKTGPQRKQSETAYTVTKDIERIFGFDDLQIDPSEDDQTLHLFVNGSARKLPEIGAGIAQFIIVLVTAAIVRPALILIDEPEQNLHPALQLDFLTSLASYAGDSVLFATHSVGLAQAAADRVYSVRRLAEGESEVTSYESTPRLSQFLGELSFSSYKELGFDQVLLVEGRTDVKTIQQFLRLYGKNHQVVLLPLGGSDMINESSEVELQELKRITPNISAVIDSERPEADAALEHSRAAFLKLCGSVGINCRVLDRRAIENYLSDSAVKAAKGEKYRALGPYEARKDVSPVWSKSENWRIAREMTLEDLEGTDLGQFLAAL